MKSLVNKIIYTVLLFSTIFAFAGCKNNHKQGDGHNHGTEKETKTEKNNNTTENEDQQEENVAALTDEQIQAVGIKIGAIEQKQLSATMQAVGELRVPNSNKANATSLFGGIIKTLNIEIGDFVKKGQVVATISNPQFIQLQEEYLSINSRLEFAEQELARQRELKEGNVGAAKNLQSATAELNTLRTRKSSLNQQIRLMGINPNSLSNSNLKSSLTVVSPISGTVSDVFAKIGSYVDVSSPIAEIIENQALHVDLQVYEKDITSIKIGQKINFVVTNSPNKSYSATVYSIGSSFSGESKTIAVHSRITGDKTGLIDGMNITGVISLDNSTTMAVPNDAIVETDGKSYIFVVKEHEEKPHAHKEGEAHDHGSEKENKFIRIEVIKGASQLGYTAITAVGELAPKAHVVVKGAFFVNAKMNDSGEHAHAH